MTHLSTWIRHLEEHDAAKVARDPLTWGLVSVFVVGVLALCAYVPPVRALTGLEFVPAALAYAPLPLLALAGGVVDKRGSARAMMWLYVVGCFFVELFPAVLIGLSRFGGAALFAAFYLITTMFHAQTLRVSGRWPLFVLGFFAHAAVSLSLDAGPEKLALWAILLPAALTSALVAGNAVLREDARRAELDRTKTALHAQLLEVEAQAGKQLEERITEILGIAHDIKSPLSAASLDLSALERQLATSQRADLAAQAAAVRASMNKLRDLFQATRERAIAMELRRESVQVTSVVDAVAVRARRAHPHVAIETVVDEQARAFVVGGPTTFERIVENLATNACEGDGARAARRVQIEARRAGDKLELEVHDDGPGFSAELLGGGIRAYQTTKKSGTGLGLFTVDRLVRACGGSLARANAPGGGARVSVVLPLG